MRRLKHWIAVVFVFLGFTIHAQVITTVAGTGVFGHTGDGGKAATATLAAPVAVVADQFYNLYLLTTADGRIRKVSGTGVISTFAGGGSSGLGDGSVATAASFNMPTAIAIDNVGNLYVADNGNARIRKITPAGVVSTIAGGGTGGDGIPATASLLTDPTGVAIDKSGNIYISSGTGDCVRKVDVSGTISTLAGTFGNAGYSGDGGPATDALLYSPAGLAADTAGNVYVADANNAVVRKIDIYGNISTVAGYVGASGYGGDGGAATAASLQNPTAVATDAYGNLFIADQGNSAVRKVNPAGIMTTVAGTGVAGYSGDLGPATEARVNNPGGMAVLGNGTVIFADQTNNRVRRVWANRPIFLSGHRVEYTVCDTSRGIDLHELLTVADSNYGYVVSWSVAAPPVHGSVALSVTATADGIEALSTPVVYTPVAGIWTMDSAMFKITDGIATDSIKLVMLPTGKRKPGSITGPTEVCAGTLDIYTDTASGGVWSVTNLHALNLDSSLIGMTSGPDTVVYTLTNVCGDTAALLPMAVASVPVVAPIAGGTAVCVAGRDTLTDATPGGSWSAVHDHANIDGAGVVAGVTPGPDAVVYTVTNFCGTGRDTLMLMVESYPTHGVIMGADSLCAGSVITLVDSVSGGVWSCSNTSAEFLSPGVLQGISGGQDTLFFTVSNVCGMAQTEKVVRVKPFSSGNIIGPAYVCLGSPTAYVDTVAGVTGMWSLTNARATVAGGVVSGIAPGPDTLTYTVTNACGTVASQKSFFIRPLPMAGFVSGPDSFCVGAAGTYSETVAGGTWLPGVGLAAGLGGAFSGLVPGFDTVFYRVYDGYCYHFAEKRVKVLALPPVETIAGGDTVCIGTTITLSDSLPGGVWTAANGRATLAPAGALCRVSGATVGTDILHYAVTNGCGTSTATHVLVIAPVPSAGVILGASILCADSVCSFHETKSSGYWRLANGYAVVNSSDSASIKLAGVSAGSDTLMYICRTACGADTSSLGFRVATAPAKPTITTSASLCYGHSEPLTSAPGGGAWTVSNGAVLLVGGVAFGWSAGTDTLIYTLSDGCGDAQDSLVMEVLASGSACTLGSLENGVAASHPRIFPVPAADVLHLEGLRLGAEIPEYRIYGIEGALVQRGVWADQAAVEREIDISRLSPGLYLLVWIDSGMETHLPFSKW